ncbi:MAG: hypothetical protein GF311_08745 [Candidatus Lokiarchaeota archaeon]|nr:hypothetical protein [Candidatus Lokiarchaeota archaeon]
MDFTCINKLDRYWGHRETSCYVLTKEEMEQYLVDGVEIVVLLKKNK